MTLWSLGHQCTRLNVESGECQYVLVFYGVDKDPPGFAISGTRRASQTGQGVYSRQVVWDSRGRQESRTSVRRSRSGSVSESISVSPKDVGLRFSLLRVDGSHMPLLLYSGFNERT